MIKAASVKGLFGDKRNMVIDVIAETAKIGDDL